MSIIPIFKSGDKEEANNYRGITITLLSCLGKLFTKVMNKRLDKWAEKGQLLKETQFEFRKGRGTTDCLFILQGMIELMLGRGYKMYAAFIDYEKCYDYFHRAATFGKLLKNGVSSKCIRMFHSMYTQMKLEIKGDAGRFDSTLGLLQGEISSPFFFSFFVNDLEDESFTAEERRITISDFWCTQTIWSCLTLQLKAYKRT